MATVKRFKAEVLSVSSSSERLEELLWVSFSNCSDEGLTLERSAFKLFTVANLRFQLS